MNTRLPLSYVWHDAKQSLASFEDLAATRVEDASNLAMEAAGYTKTSVDCHQATRRRMPGDGILTVDLFPALHSPFLPIFLNAFYILLSS